MLVAAIFIFSFLVSLLFFFLVLFSLLKTRPTLTFLLPPSTHVQVVRWSGSCRSSTRYFRLPVVSVPTLTHTLSLYQRRRPLYILMLSPWKILLRLFHLESFFLSVSQNSRFQVSESRYPQPPFFPSAELRCRIGRPAWWPFRSEISRSSHPPSRPRRRTWHDCLSNNCNRIVSKSKRKSEEKIPRLANIFEVYKRNTSVRLSSRPMDI